MNSVWYHGISLRHTQASCSTLNDHVTGVTPASLSFYGAFSFFSFFLDELFICMNLFKYAGFVVVVILGYLFVVL